jgi:hypothetical protein
MRSVVAWGSTGLGPRRGGGAATTALRAPTVRSARSHTSAGRCAATGGWRRHFSDGTGLGRCTNRLYCTLCCLQLTTKHALYQVDTLLGDSREMALPELHGLQSDKVSVCALGCEESKNECTCAVTAAYDQPLIIRARSAPA